VWSYISTPQYNTSSRHGAQLSNGYVFMMMCLIEQLIHLHGMVC